MRAPLRIATGLALSVLCLTFAVSGRATTFNVNINSTFLSGTSAVLAFDFVDGGLPNNTVTLSALSSNGTQASTSTSGNVTGSGPWVFADAGSSFFNELLVTFNRLGTQLSFSFATTDNAPAAGSFPDAFSVFVLDSTATLPLITTNDPTGSDALFLANIGGGRSVVDLYTPDQAGFSVSVRAVQTVPEPGSAFLLLIGLSSLLLTRWRRVSAPRSSR